MTSSFRCQVPDCLWKYIQIKIGICDWKAPFKVSKNKCFSFWQPHVKFSQCCYWMKSKETGKVSFRGSDGLCAHVEKPWQRNTHNSFTSLPQHLITASRPVPSRPLCLICVITLYDRGLFQIELNYRRLLAWSLSQTNPLFQYQMKALQQTSVL